MAQAYPALAAQAPTLSKKDLTDEQAILSGILATLTPQAIAAAIPSTIAEQVADELATRLAA